MSDKPEPLEPRGLNGLGGEVTKNTELHAFLLRDSRQTEAARQQAAGLRSQNLATARAGLEVAMRKSELKVAAEEARAAELVGQASDADLLPLRAPAPTQLEDGFGPADTEEQRAA